MATRGRPRWYKPDNGLAARMVLTMFLLGLVYVVAGYIVIAVFPNLSFIVVFLVIIAGAQLFFADKIALFSMGAREVSEQEAPQLHEMVARLAAQTNLPKPKVAIINSSVPNAMATGRNEKNSTIAVTTGILQQLPQPELEAVLAHEFTHILNHDMLVMTIATFFSMVAALMARNLAFMGMFGGFGYGGGGYGRGRDSEGGAGMVLMVGLLISVVVYCISFVLTRALSRYRELAADRGSALITGAPENLASALSRISGNISRIPQQDIRKMPTGAAALFIVSPFKEDSIQELLSTHPSLEHRLEQLNRIQQQMESARNG